MPSPSPDTARLKIGDIFEVPYPFVRETIDLHGEEIESWRPGVGFEMVSHDDGAAFAEGLGKQIVEVVSIHKPGRFPERTFYTRKWETPSGKLFGKPGLRVKTTHAFRRLIAGYRHGFYLNTETETDRWIAAK